MPLLLRNVRKNRWENRPEWLSQDEVQADALLDLKTDENKLSVWRIQDSRSDLDEIISAIASTRSDLVNVDYALFGQDSATKLGIKHEDMPGESLHLEANDKHRDLIDLSARRLVNLAEAIQTEGEINRIPWKRVAAILVQAVRSGKIRLELLKDNVRKKLVPQLEAGGSAQPS
jgi:hypothetical protein